MSPSLTCRCLAVLAVLLQAGSNASRADDKATVDFARKGSRLEIRVNGKPFAAYVASAGGTTRPFFEHLRTPEGVLVTRNNPPIQGEDLTDHATFHPGLWLAFGDLNGADFWRNHDPIRQVGFVEPPVGGRGEGRFAVRNRYETTEGERIGEEVCRITIRPRVSGTLILWDSTFRPAGSRPLVFGDQEEMGLGVRMATPLAVVKGGTIRNSRGGVNEAQVWGKTADWCGYQGERDGRWVGVLMMTHPDNFRSSWFHARDYGLMEANPFGRNAFTKGEPSRVTVEPGKSLRLRFGVLVFSVDGARAPDHAASYRDYLEQARTD